MSLWHVCVLGMRVWLGAFLVFHCRFFLLWLVCVLFCLFADFSENLFGDFTYVHFEKYDCDDYG